MGHDEVNVRNSGARKGSSTAADRRDDREGSVLDIEFLLKNGEAVTLKRIGIRVFDALRQMKPGTFDKRFVWGEYTGVAVEDISGWVVLQQYDDQ